MLLALAMVACTAPLTDLPNLPGGNPLVPGVAMYPFPSDFYLAPDPDAATGRSVAWHPDALPHGIAADAWAGTDGFSRIPAILAHLRGGVDPESLPDPDDPGASLLDGSAVWLIHADTGVRIPVLAEVDRQTTVVADQALILRPHVALEPSSTYVVVLRDGLRTADGGAHTPVDAFRALRDGIPTDSDAVEVQRGDFEVVNHAIANQGIDPATVVLAWSFSTRSREQLSEPLLAMHDAMAEADLSGWDVLSDEVDGDNRLIEGRFDAPDFLGPDGLLVIEDGLPVVQGTRSVPFLLTIPATVAEPRPVIVFGHGFFSSRYEPTWSSLNDSLQAWEMSAISTDFIGFDEPSWPTTVAAVGGDLAGLDVVVAQQLQSQAHHTALARLVSEELSSEVSELDGSRVRYMGISNGGTQGLPILAASPVLNQGVLVVGGGGWSHMLQRAVQWNTMGFLLENTYDEPLELQLVVSLMQLAFDPVDALSHADRLLHEPYPGREPARVVMHEAVGDSQVHNMVTHWVARTAVVPFVTPSPLDVWGLDSIEAPEPDGADVPAALFVYDEGVEPYPTGNVPPAEDNGTHDTVRRLPAYRAQVGAFLEDGTVVQVCDGACDPD